MYSPLNHIARLSASAALVLTLAGCQVELYDNLTQRDANEMTAALIQSGVDAVREGSKDGTFLIKVDESEFARAVDILSRAGYPKETHQSIGDVFRDDGDWVPSPAKEKMLREYALSQELSRTVSEIDGVISARVHLALPDRDPLSRNKTVASASVAVHHRPGLDTAGLVPRIKLILANGVEGIDYDNVSVALFEAPGAALLRGDAAVVGSGVQRSGGSGPAMAAMGGVALIAAVIGLLFYGGVGRGRKPAPAAGARRGAASFSDRYTRR